MINNVTIMGRLTADPELRQTPNGISTCAVNVAVDRNYTPQGQERQTDFIPVVAWRQTAEFISRNFSKGKLIAIVGQLRTRTYDDKRYPDVKHRVMELYADSVSFCGDKTAAPAQPAPPPYNSRSSRPSCRSAGCADGFRRLRGGYWRREFTVLTRLML